MTKPTFLTSHIVFLLVVSAPKVSHGYMGKNRSRKRIRIVKYLRNRLVYHETEGDSAWFGAGGGGWCPALGARSTLASSMVQLLSVWKSLHAQQYLLELLHPVLLGRRPVCLSGSAEKQHSPRMSPQATETSIDVHGLM